MPLVLVTTAGSATANAFCDLAYAATVAEEVFPAPVAWLEASLDDQNRAIVALTRRIGEERLRGDRVDSTQALAFPRSGILDQAELEAESTTAIPERVKRATAIGAFEVIRLWKQAGQGEAQVAGPSQNAGLSGFSLGSEFSATLETGAGRETPFERFFAQTIRPILGNLVFGPQPRMVRG